MRGNVPSYVPSDCLLPTNLFTSALVPPVAPSSTYMSLTILLQATGSMSSPASAHLAFPVSSWAEADTSPNATFLNPYVFHFSSLLPSLQTTNLVNSFSGQALSTTC